MNKKYLIIVEGEVDEVDIFEKIFLSLGFKVSRDKTLNFKNINLDLASKIFSNLDKDIYIVHSIQNKIHDIVIKFDKQTEDIEKFFGLSSNFFQGIFLIFDIDHNDKEDVDLMFNKFQDEYTGLLLVSSPSIEVLADINNKILGKTKFNSLTKEYKGKLNSYFDTNHHCNVWEYISNNFFNLLIKVLEKNYNDFKENNIMEHPKLVIEKINQLNIRNNYQCNGKTITECEYHYFTTVIYVFVAFVFGLTLEINNYSKVLNFFRNYTNKKLTKFNSM